MPLEGNVEQSVVSKHHVDVFQRDGAVHLKGFFNADEISTLRQGIEENLAQPSPRAKVASRPDDPGRFVEDFCNWDANQHYKKFIFKSRIAEAAGILMQSSTARIFHDHMLTKEAGTHQKTPWHQDQPYYNIEGRQNCSFWIPVDPVSRGATLELVAGSHRGPWLMPRTFLDSQANWFPEGSLAPLPNIDAQRERYKILGWPMEPGDAVCFHMLTLHSSAGVEPSCRRRVFSVRFIGDDIVHMPRAWKTSPEFPGLSEQLPRGGVMDHPLFPILWNS